MTWSVLNQQACWENKRKATMPLIEGRIEITQRVLARNRQRRLVLDAPPHPENGEPRACSLALPVQGRKLANVTAVVAAW